MSKEQIMKLVPLLVLLACAAQVAALDLVVDGRSDYVIVLAVDAIPAEKFAAEELVLHLEKMSGVKLPIVTDAEPLPSHAILLGRTRFLKELGVEAQWHQFGKEGYLLRVTGDHLIIAGGQPRGVLYGVYALLEDYLGCRWFAPDTSFIPQRKTIELAELIDLDPYLAPDVTGTPAFEYREPWLYTGGRHSLWWRDYFDPEYVSRTRHSGRAVDNTGRNKMDARHGAYFKIPHMGHNLSVLVPATRYASDHPEYFSLYEGKRDTEGDLELCLTHPDVVRIAAKTLLGWMQADPDADMFFIGQSDTHRHCQCERCKAACDRYTPPGKPVSEPGYGGLAGRNLQFVNQVATILEDEFPNMRIGMFAYGATRNPPANITAHRNVVVWYCPIERCSCHPLDCGPINAEFYRIPEGIWTWKQIARKVYVYDYGWGNLLTTASTVRAMRRLGVNGVMVDSIPNIQTGFGFLRYWLWAQSLRRPGWNADAGLREFMGAYYGAAADPLDRYLRLIADHRSYEPLPQERADTWRVYSGGEGFAPESVGRWTLVHTCHLTYRRPTNQAIDQAYALFEQARHVTSADSKARRHVESARMELQLFMLEHLPADDGRLKRELEGLIMVSEQLEMRTVAGIPLSQFREKIHMKIGITPTNEP